MIDNLQVPSADGLYEYAEDTTTCEVARKNLSAKVDGPI